MAITGKTPRRLLKYLLTSDPPELHANLEGLALQLDNDAEIKKGKLSERSAASLFGRLFYVEGDATAENNGVLWLDNGTTWVNINTPASGQTTYNRNIRAYSTPYEASPSRSCLVTVTFEAGAEVDASVIVKVAGSVKGVAEGKFRAAAGGSGKYYESLTFIVPAGQKYEYTGGGASAIVDNIAPL